MRLLVVVPCRGEAAVLPRKLANLARCDWPESARPHRVVVVDDGSRDATAAVARAGAAEHFADRADVEVCVVANRLRPGKPGAVGTGLAELGDGFDLAVLTDADVVLEPGALAALARAFGRDPRLALACGAQRFVRDLADDGTCRAQDGGDLRDAGGLFDRWTAAVRALESRAGLLFSVHGQLCAWLPQFGLAPRPGVAADDLDLRFQVLAREREPRRVERVADARFLEVKLEPGPARRTQMQRRARAWFQALWGSAPPPRGLLARAQWRFYRHAPGCAPFATVALAFALPAVAWAIGGPAFGAVLLGAVALACASPIGRRWLDLVRTIAAARREEARESLGDAWEISRT